MKTIAQAPTFPVPVIRSVDILSQSPSDKMSATPSVQNERAPSTVHPGIRHAKKPRHEELPGGRFFTPGIVGNRAREK